MIVFFKYLLFLYTSPLLFATSFFQNLEDNNQEEDENVEVDEDDEDNEDDEDFEERFFW